MFQLEIQTGSAAFRDSYTGKPSVVDEVLEIERIFREVSAELRAGAKEGTVRDVNGNNVGSWSR